MNYERMRHDLEHAMLRASTLKVEQERQDFVTSTFVGIHDEYLAKRINHADCLRLVNRLAAYAGGAFNDYLDLLSGAAQMGMLDVALQQSKQQNLAEQARQSSGDVTKMTGVKPIEPESEADNA